MRGKAMEDRGRAGRAGEPGFALILAILSLMLLTFLGLTLATTTSTELQIATNYRWSQQALYNAEAGLEAARIALSRVSDLGGTQWVARLPAVRTTPAAWAPPATPPGPLEATVGRDFERANCDTRAGVGYGRVLVDADDTRLEDVSVFDGQTLNGAFTVWVRRALALDNAGQYSDDPRNDALIVVAEGVAPYGGASTAITRARQAVRILETRFNLALSPAGDPCLNQGGQEGFGPTGEGYNACAPLTAGPTGSLGYAFGGPGAGTLEQISGVE